MSEEIVYHIGPKGLKDIRSSNLLGHKGDGNKVSTFVGKPSYRKMKAMKDAGFKNYNNISDMSLYSLSLQQNSDKIKEMTLESIPETRDYHGNWDTRSKAILQRVEKKYGVKEGGSLPLDGNKEVKRNFAKFKKNYKKGRSAFLKNKLGFSENVSLSEYSNIGKEVVENWADLDKLVDYNIEHGNKLQYATYIPHLRIKADAPLAILKEESRW